MNLDFTASGTAKDVLLAGGIEIHEQVLDSTPYDYSYVADNVILDAGVLQVRSVSR
jgi:hypothetical protein